MLAPATSPLTVTARIPAAATATPLVRLISPAAIMAATSAKTMRALAPSPVADARRGRDRDQAQQGGLPPERDRRAGRRRSRTVSATMARPTIA